MLCTNCGTRGHILRDCDDPITSFGVISYIVINSPDEEVGDTNKELDNILKDACVENPISTYPKIKLLLIQRKDTIGYTDFIRGKYDSSTSPDNLEMYFTEMTKTEQQRLVENNFDDIWKDLWVNHYSRSYNNEYERSRRLFESYNIQELVSRYPTSYTFSEFGFPKGRRNIREKDMECAMREFHEETGYEPGALQFTGERIIENFIGTDNINYKHIYYISKMSNVYNKPFFDRENKHQMEEIKNVGYFDYNEIMALLRPYDIEKKVVVEKVFNLIRDYEFGQSSVSV